LPIRTCPPPHHAVGPWLTAPTPFKALSFAYGPPEACFTPAHVLALDPVLLASSGIAQAKLPWLTAAAGGDTAAAAAAIAAFTDSKAPGGA
jgi:hypothetical protein